MTTFYLDFRDGNDSNAGTSFATRWKTFSGGPTRARTAPGDIVRVMQSDGPTFLCTGLWTGGTFGRTNFVSGSHNTRPIIFISSGVHNLSNGDSILIGNHATNTQANGVWQVSGLDDRRLVLIGSSGNGAGVRTGWWNKANQACVFLESGQTLLLDPGRSAWTSLVASCVVATNADRKFGPFSSSFALTSLNAQGAFMPIGDGNGVDLSSYSGISFWYKATATIGPVLNLQLQLCTGTRGQGPGKFINIPVNICPINRWLPFTYYGSLSGNVRSLAIYGNSITTTVLLNNIIAFKGSGSTELTHNTLISPDPNSNRWYPIRGINDNMVVLDTFANDSQATNTNLCYDGPTQVTGVWLMQPILMTPESFSARQHLATMYACSGVSFSCGWDKDSMENRSGSTYISYQGSLGQALTPFTNSLQSGNECSFTNFGVARCGLGIGVSYGNVYSGFSVIGCETGISSRADHNGTNTFYSGLIQGSTFRGVDFATNASRDCVFNDCQFNNNRWGHVIPANTTYFHNCTFIGNSGGAPLILQQGDEGNAVLTNCYSSGNSSIIQAAGPTTHKAVNCLFEDDQEIISNTPFINTKFSSGHHDRIIGTHKIYSTLATVDSEETIRHGVGGRCWRVSFNYGICNSNHPFVMPIGYAFIRPGDNIYVSCWARRQFTSVGAELYCPKNQVPGIEHDHISSLPAAPDTWQELSFNINGATTTGILEIYIRAYKTNGTTAGYAYFDDFTITPVSDAPNLGYTSYGVPMVTNYPSGAGSSITNTYSSRSNFGKGWN